MSPDETFVAALLRALDAVGLEAILRDALRVMRALEQTEP